MREAEAIALRPGLLPFEDTRGSLGFTCTKTDSIFSSGFLIHVANSTSAAGVEGSCDKLASVAEAGLLLSVSDSSFR